jgi:hypothetical protein
VTFESFQFLEMRWDGFIYSYFSAAGDRKEDSEVAGE